MGKALCDSFPDVSNRFFERANEVLGFDIATLCFEGPDEELVKTENQQPAIFLVSVATHHVLMQSGVKAEAVAGHSLGEYSALVAAGALRFEDGLQLTRRRGELMAEIAVRTGGIMAAVLGLPADTVVQICHEASSLGVAEVANYNSPSQTVISGEANAVEKAMELAREAGAQRVIPLQVSAPFHCSLMAPLAEAFAPELDRARITDAAVPVVANVTAEYERTADEIRRNLVTQLASSVRWSESVRYLAEAGFGTFIEVGPGKVLTGLMRAIAPEASAFHTNDPAAIEKTLNGISSGQ